MKKFFLKLNVRSAPGTLLKVGTEINEDLAKSLTENKHYYIVEEKKPEVAKKSRTRKTATVEQNQGDANAKKVKSDETTTQKQKADS